MTAADILVVEDEKIVAADIGDNLLKLGYRVAGFAVSGEDAVKQATEVQPSLVLMDIRLAGAMDGVEAARRLEAFDIPVVYLTSLADAETLQRAKTSNAYGYLSKPFSSRELRNAIEMVLHRRGDDRNRQDRQHYEFLNNLGVGIIACDCQGRVIFMNTLAENLTRWRRSEASQADLSDIWLPQDDRQPGVALPVQRAIEQDRMIEEEGYVLLGGARGARRRVIHCIATPVHHPNGRVTGAVLAFRDITGRRRREEEKRQADQLEAIRRLAGGMAHDFNNLLTVIAGYSELALSSLAPDDPLHTKIDIIRKASEQGASLTRQLLAFSRHQVMRPEVFDANELVSRMLPLLAETVGKDVKVDWIPGERLPKIKADPNQIEQALLNLTLNAREAMPEGGGTLTLRTCGMKADEGYCSEHVDVVPGHYVVISIGDTGEGIDSDARQHIFEPFFTTRSKRKATGLGLATVYGIVKQSGGHLTVHSRRGMGTLFQTLLPAHEPEEVVNGAEAARAAGQAEYLGTILLVEDEPGVRQLAKEVLAENGYFVLEAESGQAALQVCSEFRRPIDLMLTDVILPGISGRELARRLKKLRPRTRVLYMSGYSHYAMTQHGAMAAESEIIQKPFTYEVLVSRVRGALQSAAV